MIRHGTAPFLECSSKGDRRFSAFSARLRVCYGNSIENLYQGAKIFADGSTGLDWRTAKGKLPANIDDVRAYYSALWDAYIIENPHLIPVLVATTGLSDIFGQPGSACQATELWRIRGKYV